MILLGHEIEQNLRKNHKLEEYVHGSWHEGIQDYPNALNRPPLDGIHKTGEGTTNKLTTKENVRLVLARHDQKRARQHKEEDHREALDRDKEEKYLRYVKPADTGAIIPPVFP